MTPGTYLRICRESLNLSLHDVALRTETIPAVSARSRAELVDAIERDVVLLTIVDARALQPIYLFDWDDLAACAALPIAHAPSILTLRTAA